MCLTLALKNILRSGTRSLITLAAIAMGGMAVILAGGFIENSLRQMRELYINSFLGHIQVARKGYFENGAAQPFEYMIADGERLTRLLASRPHVRQAAPRLQFFGLIGSGESSLSFAAQGVEPGAESPQELAMGENLAAEDRYQVVLGTGVAQALGVKVGGSVTLLTNTKAGGINGMDLAVKGVSISASKEYDDHAIRLPLKTAQRILRTAEIQTITLHLDRTENTAAAVDDARRLLNGERPPLEVRPWQELSGADFIVKLVGFYGAFFMIFRIIIIVIVVLGVFNTMNMAVLERIGEIGTLMAMGTTRSGVIVLFLAEGLILGAVGGLLGLAAGDVAVRVISAVGITMPTAPGTTATWIARIDCVPRIYAWAYAMSLGTALLSSLYPAWKASRLEIADALRRNV